MRSGLAPGDPTDRLKLAVVEEEFTGRQKYVSGRVTLRLYVRRSVQATVPPPAARLGAPRPTQAAPSSPTRQPHPVPR